jgi:hypothetical protein
MSPKRGRDDRVRYSVLLDFESGTTDGLEDTVCAKGRQYNKDTSLMLPQDTERHYGYCFTDATSRRQRNKVNAR